MACPRVYPRPVYPITRRFATRTSQPTARLPSQASHAPWSATSTPSAWAAFCKPTCNSSRISAVHQLRVLGQVGVQHAVDQLSLAQRVVVHGSPPESGIYIQFYGRADWDALALPTMWCPRVLRPRRGSAVDRIPTDHAQELRDSGWKSKSVKHELRDNFLAALKRGDDLFPGIVGYEDTVIPEINIAVLAGHDMLFLGEKGQAKSRLMRSLVRFLDEDDPVPRHPRLPGPRRPVPADHPGRQGTRSRTRPEDRVPIAWWPRKERYAERLAPGTKFADVIGEIDPAKLAAGTSMSAEDALHFGLIPRMHRGIFAMNEIPELDELIQVGLFNILEERDVQIRGYPIQFDLDVLVLFSANPTTYNRSGKVIPQLKDRIGSLIQTHYPLDRGAGHRDHGAGGRPRPRRRVPGGRAVLHEGDHRADQRLRPASRSTSITQSGSAPGSASPTTGRWSPAPGTAACGSARSRPCRGSATSATCRRRRWASSNST